MARGLASGGIVAAWDARRALRVGAARRERAGKAVGASAADADSGHAPAELADRPHARHVGRSAKEDRAHAARAGRRRRGAASAEGVDGAYWAATITTQIGARSAASCISDAEGLGCSVRRAAKARAVDGGRYSSGACTVCRARPAGATRDQEGAGTAASRGRHAGRGDRRRDGPGPA